VYLLFGVSPAGRHLRTVDRTCRLFHSELLSVNH
jgi:hypothetical protein